MDVIKEVVDLIFAEKNSKFTDTDKAVEHFRYKLNSISDDELEELLITAGFIPDFYGKDSAEETLYTKLCEVLESIWAVRMGFKSNILSIKSGYQDVDIWIDGKVIVSDTKAFRLSRSQKAPNVKDFIKPAEITTWLSRFNPTQRGGGLVVYPTLMEWVKRSETYLHCSDKDNPIVMLPFHYLAFFLWAKNNLHFDPNSMIKLWDYDEIFPKPVATPSGYWHAMNAQILKITGCTAETLKSYLYKSENKMYDLVVEQIRIIEESKKSRAESVLHEVNNLKDSQVRELFTEYKLHKETEMYDVMLHRIRNFRLSPDEEHSEYYHRIDKLI